MKFIFLFSCFFVLTQAALSQTEQKLPPRSKMIFFGDSHTAFGYGENGNAVQYQNHGYLAWVNAFCPDLQIPKGGVLAVSGETTVQMMARLQPIQGFGAKILVVMAGGNDALYGISTATTTANLRRIYNAGLAGGMRVIALAILPRFEQNPYRDLLETSRKNINNWIKAQTDITAIDDEQELNDPSLFEEGIHLNPTGCLLLARKIAVPVNAWMAHCLPGSADAGQLGFAGNGNPLLTGSTGTKNNVSGVVASKWNLNASFAGTATVSGAKEPGADGKEIQVITITGSYSGNSRRVSFTNTTDASIVLKAGDTVEGIAEVDIPLPLTGIKNLSLRVTAVSADYTLSLAEGNSMFTTSPLPVTMLPGHYTLRTPPMKVGQGVVGHLTTQLVVEFRNTATVDSVAAIFKISSAGIQRLPLQDGPDGCIRPSGDQTICPGKPFLLQVAGSPGCSYQWMAGAAALPQQTDASLQVTQTGTYSVKIATPGCLVLSDPVVVSIGDCPLQSLVNRWTGAVSAAWENPGNWSLGVVPDQDTDVLIDGGTVPVVINTEIIVRSLKLEKGLSLVIGKNASLRVKN